MKTSIYIKSIILIAILFTGNIIIAQNNLQQAENMMQNFEFAKAAEYYENHFKTNKPLQKDLENIVNCYVNINDTKSAVKWLSELTKYNRIDPEYHFLNGRLLKTEGRYDESIVAFELYKTIVPDNKDLADKWIEGSVFAKEWIEQDPLFIVENMSDWNSDLADFALIKINDDYIITSDRKYQNQSYSENDIYSWTGTPYLKLYYIKTNGNETKSIKPIDELNYIYHNGPASFCETTNTLWYTRTKMVKARKRNLNNDPTSWVKNVNIEEYINRLEIYSAKYHNGKWSDIKAFKYNDPSFYSVGHPAISPDGKTLYFVSDMPGGFGETDIYFSEKQTDGTWSKPQNAGDIINSVGKEMFPYVDKDGNIFFSSNGHPGMGGLDIFMSKGSKDNWSKPENLKHPINSPKDDFAIFYTEPEKEGYFSSNRDGGKGSDDIYSFKYSPPPVPTELILVVKTFERLDDGEIISLSGINVHYHKDGNDSYEFEIPEKSLGIYYTNIDCNTKYIIHGINPEFFSQSKEIQTECETMTDTIFVELIFDRIIIDKPIVIENIYYDFDKWNIRPDAAIELDKIVTLLVENPQIIIELGSHTDSRGTHKYNDVLSQRRAESAVEYIISRGISSERITAKGYGERELVNHCSDGVSCSEEEHQMNRRTEFKVTGYSKSQPVIYSEK